MGARTHPSRCRACQRSAQRESCRGVPRFCSKRQSCLQRARRGRLTIQHYRKKFMFRRNESVSLKFFLVIILLSMDVAGCTTVIDRAVTPTILSPSTKVGQIIKVTGKLLEIWGMPNTPSPNATASSDFEPVSYYLVDEHETIV